MNLSHKKRGSAQRERDPRAGKQDQKGLIQFVGKPNTTVIYPMTRAMLVEFFDTVDLHLQGYLSACYHYQFQNIPSFTKES